MTKKQLRKLVIASYRKKDLDNKLVSKIAAKLTRNELKTYIKLIKSTEQAKTVTLIAPVLTDKLNLKKEMSRLFPGKTIQLKQDKSLIAGVKIVDNDLIYESNIKNTLENLVSFIKQ